MTRKEWWEEDWATPVLMFFGAAMIMVAWEQMHPAKKQAVISWLNQHGIQV